MNLRTYWRGAYRTYRCFLKNGMSCYKPWQQRRIAVTHNAGQDATWAQARLIARALRSTGK